MNIGIRDIDWLPRERAADRVEHDWLFIPRNINDVIDRSMRCKGRAGWPALT